MRAPAVSFANKLWAATLAALLTFTLIPASALAEGEGETAGASTEVLQEVSASQSDASSGVAPMLASGLVGTPTTFINSDVAFDGEPIVGSFTVDGMTFAVTEGSDVELVGVSSDRQQVTGSQEGEDSPVAPMLASGPDGLAGEGSALAVPESITYEGIDYAVTSIGSYAFYLSGVASVNLPASVGSVDDRAFRSSDVASVTVADGNPSYSSFDGALYDAAQLSLLLIPEGKQGTVLLPKTAEVAPPSVFSHCSLVQAIAVEEGSAAFASENGLLYDASLTTLLRVPAGATDITIHDGCTTIAAGAMEACASLATITAPASVTSISPDVFTSVPTVSLPAVAAATDDPGASTGATEEPSEQAGSIPASGSVTTQLTAMVALSTIDNTLPEADSSSIEVMLNEGSGGEVWSASGFVIAAYVAPAAGLQARNLEESYSLTFIETIGVSSGDGATSLWPAVGDVYMEPVQDVNADSGIPGYSYLGSAQYQAGYYKCTSGIFHMYEHSRYGYLHVCPDVWNPSSPDNIMIAKDAKTGRRLKMGPYSRAVPPGVTLGSGRERAITFSSYLLPFSLSFDVGEGSWNDGTVGIKETADIPYSTSKQVLSVPQPVAPRNYKFSGWCDDNDNLIFAAGQTAATTDISQFDVELSAGDTFMLHPQWERVEYDLGFDVDSEPGDEGYPGIEKPDETVNVESGPTVIEDPKRPGYVFQGWVIPNADGTEAIDQDLVYQDESDGKWYVDASKLPDYANDEGRVELTARWTSVISVDVPSAVTFYADVVTEGQESREGAASSAFGQNKVASQSQVDLRIVGLESTAVATEGTTLGADSILKKSDSATPSSSTQKLFSLYPTDKALTPDDLQDPDAVSATKPSDAVDFALDDLLLEKSFAADAFTIPAGDTLNLGYRLNLAETGTELDYDTLATLDEGQSASIANISYCFSADAWPAFWTYDDNGRMMNLYAIQADAEAIASGDADITAKYTAWMNADHRFYVRWFDKGVAEADADSEDDSSVYEVRIIGLNHDDKSDGSGKVGITFQLVDCLDATYRHGASIAGGWQRSELRAKMNPDDLTAGVSVNGSDDNAIWDQVPEMLQDALVTVAKKSNDRQSWNSPVPDTDNKLFLLCMREYYPYTLTASVTGFYVIPAELNSYNCTTGGFGMEGSTYDYYVALGCPYCNSAGSTAGPPSAIAKKVKGAASSMWVRSLSISDLDGNRFNYIKSNGAVWDSVVTNAYGVSPAFCL